MTKWRRPVVTDAMLEAAYDAWFCTGHRFTDKKRAIKIALEAGLAAMNVDPTPNPTPASEDAA